MYKVLVSDGTSPFVISTYDIEYPTYIEMGYEELFSGTRRKCEDFLTELLEEISA